MKRGQADAQMERLKMPNQPKATCYFQKYMTWIEYNCIHPKRKKDNVVCDKDTVCSHREPRRVCEIAKTYHIHNLKYIENNGRIKHCSQLEDCKRKEKGEYPECSEDGIRKWAEFYKKEFIMEGE
jgi:hypothetical protein